MLDLARLVLPDPCLACHRAPARAAALGLCARCRGQLQTLDGATLCAGCGRALDAGLLPAGYLCGACRAHPPSFARLYAAYAYAAPLDAIVRGLKFRRLEYLGGALAADLATRFAATVRAHDAIVAVPLHWRRRLRRGFNQAEAIAR